MNLTPSGIPAPSVHDLIPPNDEILPPAMWSLSPNPTAAYCESAIKFLPALPQISIEQKPISCYLIRLHGVFGPYALPSVAPRVNVPLLRAAHEQQMEWVGRTPWWMPYDAKVELLEIIDMAIRNRGRASLPWLRSLRETILSFPVTVDGGGAEGGAA